jgi:16S rRNA processing protein RimM
VAEERQTLPYGRLGRPHGVRGEVALRPFAGGDALLEAALPLAVEVVSDRPGQARRTMSVVAVRPADQLLLIRLEGIDSREQAATLTNAELWLAREHLSALEGDEFYVEDLIGCTVVDQQGRERGQVKATFWNGAQDVLTVNGPDGELMIPAVPEFLLEVDLDARRLVVDPHE